ncbi:MAG: hypothetical protein M5U01_08490 [Ardenticatenaceae bacterium]|nr:hypothetical protein [Ardenticatenaceae bacterium]HBY99379.1 hypothetical protein [Chloroflexota bacterium]
MTVVSQLDRLGDWLARSGIELGVDVRLLRTLPANRNEQRRLLRLLNQIESRFDDAMAEDLDPPLRWNALREELHLIPVGRNPWSYIGARACEIFSAEGYPEEQIRRADRLWHDFLFLQDGQIKPLQASAGWISALDYLLQSLYFSAMASQAEVGVRYGVSASTVGLRFRALVDTLGVVLYDHKARKRLAAARALTVETGRMSEAEFNRHLLRGPRPTVNSVVSRS